MTLTVTDNPAARTGDQVRHRRGAGQPAPRSRFTATDHRPEVSVDGAPRPIRTASPLRLELRRRLGPAPAHPTHTYAAAGTYTVTLTVTDDAGATDTTTKSVTVTAAPVARRGQGHVRPDPPGGAPRNGRRLDRRRFDLLLDQREQGHGQADQGGRGPIASLNAASVQNSTTKVEFASDKAGTGGGNYLTLSARRIGTSEYRLTARLMPDGSVRLGTGVIVSGTQVASKEVVVSNLTYAPGDVLNMSFSVTGNGTTTLAGKVWKASASEPGTRPGHQHEHRGDVAGGGISGAAGSYQRQAGPTRRWC